MLGGTRVALKSAYKHSMIFHIEQVPGVTLTSLSLMEVVVAQVVEQWHSVWSGWVWIPCPT